MTQTKNLTNSTLYRRFLTGDDNLLRNTTGSLQTRIAPDGTVLLEGYGHNLYAERREDGTVIVYEGTRQWAKAQYPPRKQGTPTTAKHIRALREEAESLGVDFVESERAPRTASAPNAVGDLRAIGRMGGYE